MRSIHRMCPKMNPEAIGKSCRPGLGEIAVIERATIMATVHTMSSSAEEPVYLPPRDFVGYGIEPPSTPWPNGAKVAVTFVLNYEEGAEATPWNGDEHSCDNLHELHYERPPTTNGQRDIMVEEMVSRRKILLIVVRVRYPSGITSPDETISKVRLEVDHLGLWESLRGHAALSEDDGRRWTRGEQKL